MSKLDSHLLLRQYQNGKSEAAAEIFERYVNRLVVLARQRLSVKMRRRVDPEDVVQSAYRSFFLHAALEEYTLEQSGDLWRLLAGITLNKLYGQIERQTAAKRSIEREKAVDDRPENMTAAPEPTPVEIVAIVEQLHLVLDRLTDDQRAAVMAQLQGHTVDEIGQLLTKSPRTVRRLLAQARAEMERQFAGDGRPEANRHEPWTSPTIDQCGQLQFNDYSIERMLGSGGTGKVYRARERSTGTNVAVKSLRKLHQGNRHAIEQFVQEAQILASLTHPNIVGVRGLGQFPGGGLFIVMDLIEGTNLQDRLRAGSLGGRKALVLVNDVVGAIAYAHKHGIVHCDLKPGNVLVDREGRPVVSDFGFARILSAESAPTRSRVGGTAGYMAPEVLRFGEAPTVAADIYGLGALLWTAAVGEVPSGQHAIRSDKEGIASLIPICQKCLAESPRDRYRTASELQGEIQRALK